MSVITFDQFLSRINRHEKFVSATLTCEPGNEGADEGHYAATEAGQLLLSVTFLSGKTTVSITFEGDDLSDIIEQATDHVNLILVTGSV